MGWELPWYSSAGSDFNVDFGVTRDWEDSPEGWPQTPRYEWWRRHDEYEDAPVG